MLRYQAPVAAGIAFAIFGIFGTLPIQLGLALSLGLDATATTAWTFAIFVTSGLVSFPLCLFRREPYPMGWSVPAGVVLAAAGARYSWPILLGTVAVTGALIAAASLAGVGRASLRFLPLPLVMGMFAGTILRLATDAFAQLAGAQADVALAAVVGYFATRLAFRERVPSSLGALAVGLAVTALTGRLPARLPLQLTVPALVVPQFDLGATITLVPPLALLVVGVGNVQSLGFLRSQGYRPPADLLTFVVGATTVINAFLGGSPAGMARVGTAIVGGPDAGPKTDRWVAALVSATMFALVAFLSVPVTALAFALPRALITTVAGLAIVGALLDALRIAFGSRLAYSSFFALVIAFTPFAPLGLEAAFWSLVGGLAIALVFEREALRAEAGREQP